MGRVLYFLLLLLVHWSDGKMFEGDPCIDFREPNGLIDVPEASGNTIDFCWRIDPKVDPYYQPKEIVLNFERFDISGGFDFFIYKSLLANPKKLLAVYREDNKTLLDQQVLTVESHTVLLVATGNNGNRNFRVEYDTPSKLEVAESYVLFWACVVALVIPMGCIAVVALPCYRRADPRKKRRCSLILYLLGLALSGLLGYLMTKRAITIEVVF